MPLAGNEKRETVKARPRGGRVKDPRGSCFCPDIFQLQVMDSLLLTHLPFQLWPMSSSILFSTNSQNDLLSSRHHLALKPLVASQPFRKTNQPASGYVGLLCVRRNAQPVPISEPLHFCPPIWDTIHGASPFSSQTSQLK